MPVHCFPEVALTAHAQCQASLVVGETSWPSVSTLLFLLLWLFWPLLIHCACALFSEAALAGICTVPTNPCCGGSLQIVREHHAISYC